MWRDSKRYDETVPGPYVRPEDEEVHLEEIESSHTLGGYRRCRYYSVVRYTIVNRSHRIYYHKDKGLVVKKNHEPVCM